MAKAPEQDEKQRRAENCLAKAAYCKWVASITPDTQLKDRYHQLPAEWKREAEST